jgi:hypothetical protein
MDRAALLARGADEVAGGKLPAAEATFRAILAVAPGDVDALSNLGAVLNIAQRHAAAEAACRAALAARPGFWAALGNLGTALHHQLRYDEAIAAYAAALRGNPGDANAWSNLGVALAAQGRLADSLLVHDAAVSLAPGNAAMHVQRALALLAAGQLEAGFAENEWRWRAPGMQSLVLAAPQWRGEPPEGRTILLHDEAGFGDTMQFVRYAPALAARGARVVVQVQPPLVRLVRRSMPAIAAVLARGEKLPPHDLHCPMMSLPHGFGTGLATVPADTPYLTPCPEATARWATRLAAAGGQSLRVGLVWAGAAWPLWAAAPPPDRPQAWAMNQRRSMTLAGLAPLAGVPGVRFVSLQYGASAEAAQPPPGMDLFDPMAEMTDFDDTAALVANLDLVIAVDTAVAHLAGALGRPVWLLSRHDACWRWLTGRRDSPWYPGMRIYRQPCPGDWDSVLAEVAGDLRRLAEG